MRQLGGRPTDADIRKMIAEVDEDESGTVDFEEFCALMLRQARSASAPSWLRALLSASSPSLALVGGAVAHENAALVIQRQSSARVAASTRPPPAQRRTGRAVTRDHLLFVVDALGTIAPQHLDLSGHGEELGAFVATELALALRRRNRSIASLALARSAVGDDGAEALASVLGANGTVTTLDLSTCGIGERGAAALLRALCGDACPLRELKLDGNDDIPPHLLEEIHRRLLRGALRSRLDAALRRRPPPTADGDGGDDEPSLAPRATRAAGRAASLEVRERWLGDEHAADVVAAAASASPPVHALDIDGSACFGDGGAAALVDGLMQQPAAAAALSSLHLGSCGLTDGGVGAIARALRCGALPSLQRLSLPGNRIALAAAPRGTDAWDLSAAGVGGALCAALCALPTFVALDLSANAAIGDAAAAALASQLLHSPSVRLLHLGATGAGDACAAACADALRSGRSALTCLCLSGAVGDTGAARLAAAIAAGAPLLELYVGDAIGDAGTEAIAEAVARGGAALQTLVLGGAVAGGVAVRNRAVGARATAALGRAARANGALRELRLTGCSAVGGAALVRLARDLQACSRLRTLHVDGCGLTSEYLPPLLSALDAVHCVHELRLLGGGDDATPRVVLTLPQRLQLSSILEGNKQIGRRRVEGWRLDKSLEEVAWVFEQLCADVAAAFADGGLHAWDGAACAQLCRNAGLGQYAQAFGSNLTGEKLGVLRCSDLPLLGIRDFAHQKELMAAVRAVVNAYERRDAVERARNQWHHLLAATAPAAARPPPRPAAAHSPPGKGVRRPAASPSAAADGGDGGIGELYPELRATVKAGLARTHRPAQSSSGGRSPPRTPRTPRDAPPTPAPSIDILRLGIAPGSPPLTDLRSTAAALDRQLLAVGALSIES